MEWRCLIILGIGSSLNHLSAGIISPLANYCFYDLLIYIIARDNCSCSTMRGLLGNRNGSQGSSQLVSVLWAVLLKGKAQKSPDLHYSVPCGPYPLPPSLWPCQCKDLGLLLLFPGGKKLLIKSYTFLQSIKICILHKE